MPHSVAKVPFGIYDGKCRVERHTDAIIGTAGMSILNKGAETLTKQLRRVSGCFLIYRRTCIPLQGNQGAF